MTKPQASRRYGGWCENEAHIGGILGVCKVNMRGGGEEGVQSQILKKK